MDQATYSGHSLNTERQHGVHAGKLLVEPRKAAFFIDDEISWVQEQLWDVVKDRLDEVMSSFAEVLRQNEKIAELLVGKESQESEESISDGKEHFKQKLTSPVNQEWIDAAAGFGSFVVSAGMPGYMASAMVHAGYQKCIEMVIPAFADRPEELGRVILGTQKLAALEGEAVLASIDHYRALKQQEEVEKRAVAFQTNVVDVINVISEQAKLLGESNEELRQEIKTVQQRSADVSGSALQSAQAMSEAAQMVVGVGEHIDKSRSNVEAATGLSRKAMENTQRTEKSIKELSLRNQDIDSVLDLIRRIARDTNMLALNATIEAARIGSAGNGFAVVAQEVKNLSLQTTQATEDIAKQVNAVHSATQQVETAASSLQEAIAGVEERNNQVEDEVTKQSDSMGQISCAIEETTISANLVSSNIDQVNNIAEHLSQKADEIEKSYAEVNEQLAKLGQRSQDFLKEIRA